MEAPRLERKLVAILAADVAGYSRHMERDEVATLATLSSHRLVVDELIALRRADHRHGGRQCGGGIRKHHRSPRLRARDPGIAGRRQRRNSRPTAAAVPHRPQCRRRDGQGRRYFWRRRQHRGPAGEPCTPGGICISRGVRDHVRKIGRYTFEDLGEQTVKNIAHPIRAFRVRLPTWPGTRRPTSGAVSPGAAEQPPTPDGVRARVLGVDQGRRGPRGVRGLPGEISGWRVRRSRRDAAEGPARSRKRRPAVSPRPTTWSSPTGTR